MADFLRNKAIGVAPFEGKQSVGTVAGQLKARHARAARSRVPQAAGGSRTPAPKAGETPAFPGNAAVVVIFASCSQRGYIGAVLNQRKGNDLAGSHLRPRRGRHSRLRRMGLWLRTSRRRTDPIAE